MAMIAAEDFAVQTTLMKSMSQEEFDECVGTIGVSYESGHARRSHLPFRARLINCVQDPEMKQRAVDTLKPRDLEWCRANVDGAGAWPAQRPKVPSAMDLAGAEAIRRMIKNEVDENK